MFKRFAPVLAGLGALLVVGFTPALASASPTWGTPSPTPSGYGYQTQRAENFDGLVSTINPGGYVQAAGPVAGTGTVREVSGTEVIFDLGGSDVRVDYAAVGSPTLDLASCSAVIDAPDLAWQFDGGTGADRYASGHGDVTIVELLSFSERNGQCPLDGYGYMTQTNTGPCYRDHGRQIEPTFYSVEFQGEGTARVGQPTTVVAPCPCETGYPTPPVYASTDAYLTR